MEMEMPSDIELVSEYAVYVTVLEEHAKKMENDNIKPRKCF